MCCTVTIPEMAQGRILSSTGSLYTVETSCGICTCKARGVFRKRGITPYVGDYVQLSADHQVICEILPRKNSILRPPVANLDQILFVVSSCRPAPNLQLLDAFLTVAAYQSIRSVLVVTKIDLDRAEALTALYQNVGIPVLTVDYQKPETVAAVVALLNGRVSMMTGNSGVGKSTLLNAIDPSLHLPVSEISEKLGCGKHTTRQVQLYVCAGGYLADTPGFSTFDAPQYVRMEKEKIAACFPEFQPYFGNCRFSDCAHVCEKGCAILEAVENGLITKSRHASYVSLYREAQQRKSWET